MRGLLQIELSLETRRDGPQISARRLSLFEKDPETYPLDSKETRRWRAALERLSKRRTEPKIEKEI